MDDFVVSNLHEARNEWAARLVGILTPLIIDGFRSIFNESWKLAVDNNEVDKYLMTFQNLLCRVPKWNSIIVEEERKRIIEKSGCGYLEDLITCVHIIQLKVLTSIRVGHRQKKIDIATPKLDSFIHKVYINGARKIYKNVYLFEKNVLALQAQKNNRDLELIIQECIMITIRDSIPTESIIKAYLDESVEVEEEVIIENVDTPELLGDNGKPSENKGDVSNPEEDRPSEIDMSNFKNKEDEVPDVVPAIKNIDNEAVVSRLSFNDVDSFIDTENKISEAKVSKNVDDLERISVDRHMQRKLRELEEEDDSHNKISIDSESIKLDDIMDLDDLDSHFTKSMSGSANIPLLDVEEL